LVFEGAVFAVPASVLAPGAAVAAGAVGVGAVALGAALGAALTAGAVGAGVVDGGLVEGGAVGAGAFDDGAELADAGGGTVASCDCASASPSPRKAYNPSNVPRARIISSEDTLTNDETLA
jgi:hypothetical protein